MGAQTIPGAGEAKRVHNVRTALVLVSVAVVLFVGVVVRHAFFA